jgi:YVTN family beta-propeller protein
VIGVPIPVASAAGIAVTPDGSKVYVTNEFSNTVTGISTATNTVIPPPIPVGNTPFGIAISPDGSKVFVYVANFVSGTVSVISPPTNAVTTIPAGGIGPEGLALTPDGTKLYVADQGSNHVSVIATATNIVIPPPIGVGRAPAAFGKFIIPLYLAGEPGSANCHGKSVSALAQEFRTLVHAADTLGFASDTALQDTIKAFCDPATN